MCWTSAAASAAATGCWQPSMVGARKVIAVDVEEGLIDRAQRDALAAGLAESIEHQPACPPPLPFDDASFDAVFSKDAIVHVSDKLGLYREIFRVLKPGGFFVGADWLGSEQTSVNLSLSQTGWTMRALSFTFALMINCIEFCTRLVLSTPERRIAIAGIVC